MKQPLATLLILIAACACGSDVKSSAPAASASASAGKGAAPKGPPKSRKGGPIEPEPTSTEADPGPPKVEFQETDFSETDRSRDPFRSFTDIFVEQAKSKVRSQVHVVAKNYAVDELRLVVE